jgi:hypothetical protein
MTGFVDAEAFTRFERDGWSRAAEGYHRFFTPVTGRVTEPLLDAVEVGRGATDPAPASGLRIGGAPRQSRPHGWRAHTTPPPARAGRPAPPAGAAPAYDLSDHYCTANICPPKIGYVAVYLADNHISAAYSRTLAPVVTRVVPKFLDW